MQPNVVDLRYLDVRLDVSSNNLSLKYQKFTPSSSIFEIVAKTQLLCLQVYNKYSWYPFI